jgi:hypothetical protein
LLIWSLIANAASFIPPIHNPADLVMLGSRILPPLTRVSRPILLSALIPALGEILLPW